MQTPDLAPSPRRPRQRGVSLLFALLSLVAMSFAMLALVRSVDTGTQLLGNLGFKQDATAATDQAARQAIAWLVGNKTSLIDDATTSGYYASTRELASDGSVIPPVDATGQQIAGTPNRQLIDWDGDGCKAAPSGSYHGCDVLSASAGTINGNTARYAVFRLCSKPGDPLADPSISCAQYATGGAGCGGSKSGGGGYGEKPLSCAKSNTYYRIVVRVLGARNTASFTETIVHF
jgi:type IV pilus assembly protein PilX